MASGYTYAYRPRSSKTNNHTSSTTSPSPLRHSVSAIFEPIDSRQIVSPDENTSTKRQYSKIESRSAFLDSSNSPSLRAPISLDELRHRRDSQRVVLGSLAQAPYGDGKVIQDKAQNNEVKFAEIDYQKDQQKIRPLSFAVSRSDSVRGPGRERPISLGSTAQVPSQPNLTDVAGLQRSTTEHLRTLGRYAEKNGEEEFGLVSPEQEVVGLHGRRRLQRTMSKIGKKNSDQSSLASGWQTTRWMDQQRQFLQAYEYLCHIGEAKEWIEDVIQKQIPPIVELEEALRNGVTLAEVVQAIFPDRQIRIFRNIKLQFRHSDNIALFFRFLAEVDLPELFRFELVDLYEKKNIPKVIYCIHALSWLLFRKGIVDFRIGNLLGQLQFADHELEATQKGLDKAGVSMPNFSGMSASFDIVPEEPPESQEDREKRELLLHDMAVQDLQSQIRGSLLRVMLGDTMQRLWNSEPRLVLLQSMTRADLVRQKTAYQSDMRRFAIRLQSSIRGSQSRQKRKNALQYWLNRPDLAISLQSRCRARKTRLNYKSQKLTIDHSQESIKQIQSVIRGALARWNVGDQYHATRQAEEHVNNLQAAIRGAQTRRKIDTRWKSMNKQTQTIEKLQAAIRSQNIRNNKQRTQAELQTKTNNIILLQALVRASKTRMVRKETLFSLSQSSGSITIVQAAIRGFLIRLNRKKDVKRLYACEDTVTDLQSLIRAYLNRQDVYSVLCDLNNVEETIVQLQSIARGRLLQQSIGLALTQLTEEEEYLTELQAFLRGHIVRAKYAEKQKFYKQNMQKVIKIQSFVRAKQQGEAYKSLTSGKNPPVGTVKNFVHLLNDSGFDFDEELEFERLRKTVTRHVRQNEMAEQYVDQLDIKIALLVKNKITLDEVVRHQRQFGGHIGSLLNNKDLSSKDPFDLRALNKNSRKKLEHYQEMFFLLQTQPHYLARLFRRFREQGLPEKESKRTELLMMGMFGFAQKRREEYYLLKLMAGCIKEEADASTSLQDYCRGNFFWTKIFMAYSKSPRDRKFMKEIFGPVVHENIVDNQELDLESDPLQIYRAAINNEELTTGQLSTRSHDVTREQAIRDPETRDLFVAHLQDLRDIADHAFNLLEELLTRMPYGVRYIMQQQCVLLEQRFTHEDPHVLLQTCGQWLWKNYLSPVLMQPEVWAVIDRSLTPPQKRNLGEVSKVIGQVFAGRHFGGENVYLQPLNSWLTESIERVDNLLLTLINVRDAEEQFDIDEFNDLYSTTKPTLYMKMADIFTIHHLVADHVDLLCPDKDDALRETIKEVGSARTNENEMMGVGSQEITLQLNPKFLSIQDSDGDIKAVLMETKRLVLYIIRVQSGANLLDILVKPISQEDDDKWLALLDEEYMQQNDIKSRKKPNYAASIVSAGPAASSLDVSTLTYAELKSICLENILNLERYGKLSRNNQYQDLLNAIAVDIRTKHRRRVQRAREIEGVRATLAQLDAKAAFLDEQLQSYNDYVEQAMVTLQNKKGTKKKFLMPFSRQYNHERELAKSGRIPKFGSFKYSARQLAEKGVLVSWTGFTEDKWSRISVTISSDEVGVFHIEGSTGSMMIPGASAIVPLDDLLQAQFENSQFIHLFPDAGLKFNVNLFLNLVYKKFFD